MTTADRIKNRRIELGLTQTEVAKRMGYKTKAAVSKVECQGDNVTLKSVEKFALALNCTPAFLMGWEEEGSENHKEETAERLEKFAEFINLYEQLDDSNRKLVDNMLTALSSKQSTHPVSQD